MHDSIHTIPTAIQAEDFGSLLDGRSTKVFTLSHPSGLRVRVTNFGAALVSCEAPDRDGKMADLTLGYDSIAGYEAATEPYFGASVGRFANRIAKGKFTLDGKDYVLATNNSPAGIPCHLHGGIVGLSRVIWSAEPSDDGRSVTFTYLSKDGEEGYPGNLNVRVTYSITENAELVWEAVATTDTPTVLNLINHSYWNLSGDPSTLITDHELTLFADKYLPTDVGMIPTGEIAPVTGTPMDFTTPHKIGSRINDDFEALKIGFGYDHCWILSGPKKNNIAPVARLKDPKSGRILEMFTNQPAVQLYTSNWLAEDQFKGDHIPAKNGAIYARHSGCCLETGNCPNAPNQPEFPSAVLRPGETYRHTLVHRFSVDL